MYRKCVAIVVLDPVSKLCLVGKRAGKQYGETEGWQFPQGGIDEGESYSCAAKRELFEEMGIRSCSVDFKSPVSVKVCCVADINYAFSNYNFKDKHETYLPSVQFVKNSGPYRYDYPQNVKFREKGQEQTWFLAYKKEKCNIVLGHEFSKYAWVSSTFALNNIVDFKKEVYAKALADLGLLN